MAVIIFNINGYPVNSAKEENDLKIHRGDIELIKADGRLKTISDDDYHSYIAREKTAILDDFDNIIQIYQDNLQKTLTEKRLFLNQAEHSGLKTRLEGLKSGLENVDKSGITFPITTTFARYWIDNESSEMFDIQFIS